MKIILAILIPILIVACSQERLEFSGEPRHYFEESHFRQTIPGNARYEPEDRIGTIRQNAEGWSQPIYRTRTKPELVKVTDKYTNRTVMWPIPLEAKPAPEADAHMAIISFEDEMVYEFWAAEWSLGEIKTGSFQSFPLYGNATSHPHWYRVNAAGWSTMAGMIIREDLLDEDGELLENFTINHALAISLPVDLVPKHLFVAPAVGGERLGRAAGGIPIGTHLALPRDLDVESLKVHPLTREMARAMRDYGAYVIDTNDNPQYLGKYVGAVRIEIGLVKEAFGIANDQLRDLVQSEMHGIMQEHGIYRVVFGKNDFS